MRLLRKLSVSGIFLAIGVGMIYAGYIGMNDFDLWWSGVYLALLFFGLLCLAFGPAYLIQEQASRTAYESKERAYRMSMTGPYFRGPPGDGGPAESIYKKER